MLIPPEQVQALADAIVELADNPTLREKLGDAARSIADKFSEHRVAASWLEALDQ
jgi:glycosyltransferase involved in cell wall biosynthesis